MSSAGTQGPDTLANPEFGRVDGIFLLGSRNPLTFRDVKTHLLLVSCEASGTLWSLFFHLPKGHIHLYLR